MSRSTKRKVVSAAKKTTSIFDKTVTLEEMMADETRRKMIVTLYRALKDFQNGLQKLNNMCNANPTLPAAFLSYTRAIQCIKSNIAFDSDLPSEAIDTGKAALTVAHMRVALQYNGVPPSFLVKFVDSVKSDLYDSFIEPQPSSSDMYFVIRRTF